MKKTIEMTFLPDGEVKVQTKGFTGKSCLTATKFLEDTLGKKGETKLTPEYYTAGIQNTQQIEQG